MKKKNPPKLCEIFSENQAYDDLFVQTQPWGTVLGNCSHHPVVGLLGQNSKWQFSEM